MLALQALDNLLAEAGNQRLLRDALQAAFERDPLKFFRVYVMPLMPRDLKLTLDAERGVVAWKPLAEAFPPVDGGD
jgi:hypothetical protein